MARRGIHLLAAGTIVAACAGTAGGWSTHALSSRPIATSTCAPAEPDDAEKSFRKMEEKLQSAKTFTVNFEATFDGTLRGKLKGSLVCSDKNRSREEIDGDLTFGTTAGKRVTMRMVSDGTKMATTSGIGTDPQTHVVDAMKDLGAAQRLFAARAGIVCPTLLLAENVRPGEKPPERKPEDHVRVRDFRLGKTERLGGRDTTVIHYEMIGRAFKEPLAATVWVDAETNLPVKRVVEVKQDDLAVTLTENYTNQAVGGRVDEQSFAIPTP
jgi:outer membrane lipoprotein-sorting protein